MSDSAFAGTTCRQGLPAPASYPTVWGRVLGATRRHQLVCSAVECRIWQWTEHICHTPSLSSSMKGRTARRLLVEGLAPGAPGAERRRPYLTVLVELPQAGGVRMVGNLLGDPLQAVVIGADVEAVFEDHDDADPPFTLVQWRISVVSPL